MTNQAHRTAKLAIGDKQLDLPIYQGTIGPDVIDIRRLYSDGGVFTFDPGYTSTGSCESAITYIDGDKGELLYRGYPIEQLAEKSTFLEVSYLLLYGELPTAAQLEDFVTRVTNHTMLHEQMSYFFRGFRRDAHPMAIVCGTMGAMAAFYHDSTDITDAWQREVATIRMIAKMPTIVAWAYKYSVGQPFVYPRNNLDYASNFLNMCFAVPAEEYVVDPILSRAVDRIFTLHADHEQNASTSTVRLASSSGANPFACIAAGVACLWGPAHGGANEACLRMLREIGTVDRIPEYIARAKDKDDPFRLMGFGHRVYKNFDPRAKVMKQSADEVLGLLGIENNPTLQVAKELERIALEDELLHRQEALSQRRLLLRDHPRRDRVPDLALHADLRAGAHGRLDLAVEGDAGGPGAQDRAAAAALHRQDLSRLRGCRGPLRRNPPGRCADAKRARCQGFTGSRPCTGHAQVMHNAYASRSLLPARTATAAAGMAESLRLRAEPPQGLRVLLRHEQDLHRHRRQDRRPRREAGGVRPRAGAGRRLGRHRADLRLLRGLAARHQHRHHHRHLPDGLPGAEHPEPRLRRHPGQARRADPRGRGRGSSSSASST